MNDQHTRNNYQGEVESNLVTFSSLIEQKSFATVEEIGETVSERVNRAFKTGHHTKMMSKKMCKRIDGQVYLKHMMRKQTAVFTQIHAKSRKDFGYTFTVVNYFETKGGFVYVVRFGITYPTIYMFTGHFFDRLLERGMNNKDHAARMQGVFRMLRHMDRSDTLAFINNHQAYMAAFGGLCLGVNHRFSTLNPLFNFSGVEQQVPESRDVFMFLTYVNKEMLGPEQKFLYEQMAKALAGDNVFGESKLLIDE